ncbi:hypothetical protein GALL_451700 [mine drainage metagenome]|uniref:Uncharacterized protein n=1 Tax=mine drainage metagenome TaxID=410659 RepID=A0A1J5PNX3_9ZZZZ
MALTHFQCFGDKKGLRIHGGKKGFLELPEQHFAAADQARLQQGGLHRYILGRLAQAVTDGAHACANFESRVPATADEVFNLRGQHRIAGRRPVVRQQQQHIDIRKRKLLLAAETTDCQQGKRCSKTGLLPQRGQCGIDQPGQLEHGGIDTPRGRTGAGQNRQQGIFLFKKMTAQARLGAHDRAAGWVHAGALTKSGSAGLLSDRVSTS